MQALARLCVRRPVFASVLIIALVVVGGVGYSRLGTDRYPKVDFPTVAVITRLPGAAPEEVETEVTDKIEESINTIAGIDELQSVSAEGISQIFVTFILEKSADIGAQEVRDKVNRVLAELPRDIDQPIVEKLDPDATPILSIALSGRRTLRETTEYADKVLRRQIESVNGVGQVTILGGRSRRINVRLDTERMKAYGLSAVDVRRALQTQNVKIPGGTLKAGSNEATVRVYGRVANAKEFEQIFITQRSGLPVRVGDVAKVEDSEEDAERAASKDGVPTVVLSVRKQSGTNTIAVINALKERLAEIAPQLPAGYSTEIVRDQSLFIKAAVDTVQEHLLLGGFLAALVVLLFLGNIRSTLIAAIAIPTSIISTYALMYAMGFTLNVLTLLALTLAVGIVIDDAIVVLENIFRFIEEKKVMPFQAAIDATKEIGLAVLATTLSLVAVFLPVAFMGGIVGRFMNSFGLTMAFAILVSLLVSFSLTPMLSARFLKRKEDKKEGSKARGFYAVIDRTYAAMLKWSIAHRWAVVVACLLVLATIPVLFKVVPKNFLPFDDEAQFEVNFRAPEGRSLEATALIGNRISKDVKTLPGVEYALLTVGADDAKTPNVGSVYVKLVDADKRKESQTTVMDRVRREILPRYADAKLRTDVSYVNAFSSGQKNAEIMYVINGPDLDKLAKVSEALMEKLRTVPGIVDVDSSLIFGKPELGVTVGRSKASDLGVSVADVADTLRILVGGEKVSAFDDGGEQYDVYLRARPEDRADEASLKRFNVPSYRLGAVPLEDVTSFRAGVGPSEIRRLNRRRQVTIMANMNPGYSSQTALDLLVKETKALKLDASYTYRFIGRSKEQGRSAQNFLLAFGLSGIFMYLILAAQFESWLHPVTILLALPLTVPFALLSILIFGQSINIFTSLGILVLFGVVKKNSILQVEFANQLRERGMDRDAAVVLACRERLRPILMTTMAFVAGMLPLLISSGPGSGTNRAIGSVIAGGQTLALLLTLLATPVAYSLFDDAQQRAGRLVKRLRRVAPRVAVLVIAFLLSACRNGGDPNVVVLSGRLEAPMVDLAPKVAGRVVEVKVKEGDRVKSGDLIARLDLGETALAPERDAKGLESAEARFNDLKVGSRAAEIKGAEQEVADRRAAVELAKPELERYQILLSKKVGTPRDVDVARANLERAQASLKMSEEKLLLVREGFRQWQTEQARADVSRARTVLKQSESVAREAEIRAPADGVILHRMAEPGLLLGAGQPAVTMAFLDRLYVRTYIPETQLGRVRIGSAAEVSVDAFKGRTFPAKVTEISPDAEFTPKPVDTSRERVNTVYAAKVDLDAGWNAPLVPGQPADVRVRTAESAPK